MSKRMPGLFVEYRTKGYGDGYLPATPHDALAFLGFVECSVCGGSGKEKCAVAYVEHDDPCPHCAAGLVPSDAAVEAAAEGAYRWLHPEEKWEEAPEADRHIYRRQARAALLGFADA